MKLPFYIGLPLRPLPDWVATVTWIPKHVESCVGKMIFGSLVVVSNHSGAYEIRRILPIGVCVWVVRSKNMHIQIDFKSPSGSSLPTLINMNPVVPAWLFFGAIGLAWGALLARLT